MAWHSLHRARLLGLRAAHIPHFHTAAGKRGARTEAPNLHAKRNEQKQEEKVSAGSNESAVRRQLTPPRACAPDRATDGAFPPAVSPCSVEELMLSLALCSDVKGRQNNGE
jgi:hypothetical protein